MSATSLYPARREFEHSLRASDEGPGFAASMTTRLDAGDLRAMSLTFVVTAAVVLSMAVASDLYLLGLISRPISLDGLMTYRLAEDLLPWSFSFSCVAGIALILGLVVAVRTGAPRPPVRLSQTGFMLPIPRLEPRRG